MNATEAVTLCRMVRAICPQQAMDEHTPKAWALLLEGVRIEDANAAVVQLGRRQVFIAPSEIITEVKKIRSERIRKHGTPIPPAGLSTAVDLAWRRDALTRVGDGETLDVPVFHEIDHENPADMAERNRAVRAEARAALAAVMQRRKTVEEEAPSE